jgi:hypothetical protein
MNQTRNVSGVKDLEAYLHDELAKAWKEEQAEFNQLKRLARALEIEKVIVSPESASPDFQGYYIYCGWELNTLFARKWGLSKEQINSINRKEGPAILIDSDSCFEQGASRTLAHEIGHHLYRLAQFTKEEKSMSVTKTMKGFFPNDEYLHQSRDEICAESFSEFLTVPALRTSIKRHCDSILQKVRVHNPNAAKLIESYRRTALNNPQEGNGRL